MTTETPPCPEACDEWQDGTINLGVRGAVGLLSIERCDACERFATDDEAAKYVRRLLGGGEELLAASKALVQQVRRMAEALRLDHAEGSRLLAASWMGLVDRCERAITAIEV